MLISTSNLSPVSIWPLLGVLHPHHMEQLMQEAASEIFQLYFGFGDVLMPDLFHTDRTVGKSIVALQHHLAMGDNIHGG